MSYYQSDKQRAAIEMWNVATGGDKHSPATAFAGIAAANKAFKYIPVYQKDFTAGNATQEEGAAWRFLEQWARDLKGEM